MNNKDKLSIIGVFAAMATVLALCAFGFNLVSATGATNTVSANVVVPNFCFYTVSNTQILFNNAGAGIPPGTTSPANVITFTDSIGNIGANILIQGITPSGNWIGGGTQFYLANTLYGPSSASANNALTTAAVDTHVYVASGGTANSLWLAVQIPSGQAAATYNSVITTTTSC